MQDANDQPPVFNRWGSWYLVLMFALLLQIMLYFLITRQFA
jgi:hypothetical protein